MSSDEYLKPAEAAAYLKSSTSTLAKLRCAGGRRGPCYVKLGRAIRYKKSDLDEFMLASRVGSTFEEVGDD